jgi:hypothetical protein
MIIRKVCAWCGRHMGIKKFTGIDGSGPCVSHGICPDCTQKATFELEEIAARYMAKNHISNPGKEKADE